MDRLWDLLWMSGIFRIPSLLWPGALPVSRGRLSDPGPGGRPLRGSGSFSGIPGCVEIPPDHAWAVSARGHQRPGP